MTKFPIHFPVALLIILALAACSSAASPSPTPSASSSAAPTTAATPGTATMSNVAAAPKPANATLKITSPTANGSATGGDLKVTIDYAGPDLVAAAQAKKLDDYHLHYFLDGDATPYIGTTTPIPAGNPKIIHSAAKEVTFPGVTAGSHTVTVVMTGSNHISVNPPVSDTVTFTVK